jgi:hypothetical protein
MTSSTLLVTLAHEIATTSKTMDKQPARRISITKSKPALSSRGSRHQWDMYSKIDYILSHMVKMN